MFAPQSEIKYLAIKELLSLVIPNSIDALKYNTIEKEAGDDSLQKNWISNSTSQEPFSKVTKRFKKQCQSFRSKSHHFFLHNFEF